MRRWNFLLVSGLVLGAQAVAQSAGAASGPIDQLVSTDNDNQIVVTARSDPEPKVAEARAQARMITDVSNVFGAPLPLFQKPVCPGVSGLPIELAEYIADRIRYNAEQAGLKLAEAGNCRSNLIVAFVLNGQKALIDYHRKRNDVLVRIPLFERRELLANGGPVHAFVLSRHMTRDGAPLKVEPDQGYEILNTQSSNSLFLLNSRTDIEASVIVIDIPAIDGMSAKQIADYATMRGLARTRAVSGDATYGTILNLFDSDAGHPAELTTFDIAYLKTLYSNAPNLAAAAKLGGVKYQMRKALEAAGTGSSE